MGKQPRSIRLQALASYPFLLLSSDSADISPVSAETHPPDGQKSHQTLIIALVVALVLAILVGFTGFFGWGAQAVDLVHITCASSSVYFPDPYTSGVGSLELGVANPNHIDVNAIWNIIIVYRGGATFTSSQGFIVPASGRATPVFYFDVKNSEADGMTGNATIIVNAEYHALIFSYSRQFYQSNASSC